MVTFEINPQVPALCVGKEGRKLIGLRRYKSVAQQGREQSSLWVLNKKSFCNMTRSPFLSRTCSTPGTAWRPPCTSHWSSNHPLRSGYVQCRDDERTFWAAEKFVQGLTHACKWWKGDWNVCLLYMSLTVRRLCSHTTSHLHFLASLCYVQ